MGSLSQRRIGLLALASLAPACVMAPLPPPSHYVVSATNSGGAIEPAVPSEDPDQGLRVLDPNAAAALRPGRTVAFFPPDRCRGDLPAASATATPEAVDMANDCGVLISALETSVADRYSVVSWQTLKGVDPFARAAERNVDIIFEVDSLGLNELDHDSTSQLRLDFYQQTNANDRALLNLGAAELPALAERCRSNLAALPSPAVRSFTGAIKAVEVSSGRALVYYQRTLADDLGDADASARELYYRAQPTAMPGSNPYNMLQRTGGGVAALGAAAFVTGVVRVLGRDRRCRPLARARHDRKHRRAGRGRVRVHRWPRARPRRQRQGQEERATGQLPGARRGALRAAGHAALAADPARCADERRRQLLLVHQRPHGRARRRARA